MAADAAAPSLGTGRETTRASAGGAEPETHRMTYTDYLRKLDELDRLLNDPDVPMQPGKVWSLLAEITHHDAPDVLGADRHGGIGSC